MSAAQREFLVTDVPVGSVVGGRYRVEGHVADGAVASVYRARDAELGRAVALKILDPLRGADPVGRARFEREFQALCKLSHPGVAACIDFVRDGELDVLVLEFVEGATLAARLGEGRFHRIDDATSIARRLAVALEACHAEGIVHRDLKPANVMLHPERGPVILDFGVAWFGATANLTKTGALIGSPQYMAPELFVSSLADARVDVYAVGAMLFEMLTGRAVRVGRNVAELAAGLNEVPPAVSSLRPDVPAALDAIVARAVAPRAEDRYATAFELAEALERSLPGAPRGLRARTLCRACRTQHVVDLPFCAGCGVPVSWGLRPGAYAVQALAVADVDRCVAWLGSRHRAAVVPSETALRARLRHAPVPIAVSVAEETAEQLVAEAHEAGCKAEIVRARAIFGTRIKAGAATSLEVGVTMAMHVLAVLGVAVLLLFVLHVSPADRWFVYFAPSLVACVGIVAALLYARRPLLRGDPSDAGIEAPRAGVERVIALLTTLKTDRARCLAAGAVVRAAPLLTARGGRYDGARDAVWSALGEALAAAADVDTYAAHLEGRSRSQLAAEIEAVRTRAARDNSAATARLAELERDRVDLLETSIAYDVAARRALESSREISAALDGDRPPEGWPVSHPAAGKP